MKKVLNIIRWSYPLFGGLIMFNVLRAITDLTKKNTFWTGNLLQHLISIFFIVWFCYLCDIYWNFFWLKKSRLLSKGRLSVLKEYASVFLQIFIPLNILMLIGEYIGIFYMGDGIVDYLLANVVFIPLLLLYYTLLRNNVVNTIYRDQALLVEKLKVEKSETELNYLKAQYHPHFLFNALNTVYFQIDMQNKKAKHTVELLSELLRYQLYDVSQHVPVSRELDFMENYIKFQQLRMSEDIQLHMDIDPKLNNQIIHPLLFQPLLENSFKYIGGNYKINITVSVVEDKIKFSIENSTFKSGELSHKKGKGIGIENLKRRLVILYPDAHTLTTEQKEDSFYAELIIKPNLHEN